MCDAPKAERNTHSEDLCAAIKYLLEGALIGIRSHVFLEQSDTVIDDNLLDEIRSTNSPKALSDLLRRIQQIYESALYDSVRIGSMGLHMYKRTQYFLIGNYLKTARYILRRISRIEIGHAADLSR